MYSIFPILPKIRIEINKFIEEINKVPTQIIDSLKAEM